MQPNLRREIRVLCKRQSGGGSDEVGWPWRERRVQRDETSRLFLHQNVLQLQYLAREPLHIAGNLFLRVEQKSASSSFALFSSPRPVLGSSMASERTFQEICPLCCHERDTDIAQWGVCSSLQNVLAAFIMFILVKTTCNFYQEADTQKFLCCAVNIKLNKSPISSFFNN